ncbi:NAD(P)-binding domain protein [Niveomyces insectorum RCEF 264]|uniref:D-xylose 1-dehydrogenase (NADP(+), D-xylono-1,5-lactone-forming) n=1 Tax=Niveomyces insectorum RCEF 264 TaxID=1081102 RepID=A0A167VJ64_9HYPO|nr:NAD(P)-binding domain protein [Niveomyces insectorum RCEF 264]
MDFVVRNWRTLFPPEPPKSDNALKFGLIGAANIAPSALIRPAKSHPEVTIQGVAARDRKKAAAFATKHRIPQVYDSYEALLNDPNIDAVYIALPNGLHFEWAMRALAQGKHVLLEKPSVNNGDEATRLFTSPLVRQPRVDGSPPPLLLEAFHFRFQPTWQYFLSLLDRPNINFANAVAKVPGFFFKKDDIRFRYNLGGGSMMDLGTYNFAALRDVFQAEPEACLSCVVRKCAAPHELCDAAATTRFRFPGGHLGMAECDLQANTLIPHIPTVEVQHHPIAVAVNAVPGLKPPPKVPDGYELVRERRITLYNFILCGFWHRIDIEDEYKVRRIDNHQIVYGRWQKKTSKKAYTFKDAGIDQPGEPFWLSYRHQLEQFVNRVRTRPGSGLWVSHDDSRNQARMIDMAYKETDLPLRPASQFQLQQQAAQPQQGAPQQAEPQQAEPQQEELQQAEPQQDAPQQNETAHHEQEQVVPGHGEPQQTVPDPGPAEPNTPAN